MTRKRKQYTQEFRDSAVKLIIELGCKVAEAAQNSGINRSVLGRWLRESEADGDNGSNVSSGKELQTGLTRLRKENQRLKLEREILIKKSGGLLCGGIGVRYQLIDPEKKACSSALLCEVTRVSRSGCYSWLNRGKSPRRQEWERLIPVVHEANRVSKQTRGARRIAEEVEAVGVPCGKTKARTLMKLANVTAKQKKKFKVTTDSKHNLPVAPNLLECKFRVAEPDKVYVFDLAYLWTQEGWLYLVVVILIFSPGRLQGGSLNNHKR